MKTIVRITFSLSLLLALGCGKENRPQLEIDQEKIVQYLTDNNITATLHSSGMYYRITREGTGPNPGPQARVTIRYKGYLLDGTVFDQTAEGRTATFSLLELIPGWQVAVPLLKRGGAGTFYLPSYLGYGRRGSGIIEPNSVLIFEIDLVDFVE